ncbi:MAG: zinc-binding dehydrogenase [Gemmataceae bacterium]
MRAIVLREIGGPENLKLETLSDPIPGPGEVVVKLHAAALNHRDVWIRRGQYAGIKLPIILGSDGAGEVMAVGANVDPGWLKQNVIINPGLDWGEDERAQSANFRILGLPDSGTYAEFVKVPTTNIHPTPGGWSPAEAAALPLAGLTAYRAVVTRAKVQDGESVLITGIGGGVSQCALQIAMAIGARVFITSGDDEKIERAKQLGAAGGVNYHTADWVKKLQATSGGIDAAIDSAGGETLNGIIEVLKPGGRVATYGATTGPTPNFEIRRVFWKQISILGTTMGRPEEFAALLDLYTTSGLRPVVDQIFPLAQASEAHRRMETASQFGKIVLDITPPHGPHDTGGLLPATEAESQA